MSLTLGTLPNGTGASGSATTIADSGLATGNVGITGGAIHAVLWNMSKIADMRTYEKLA